MGFDPVSYILGAKSGGGGGITPADNGKVVVNGALVSQTAKTVTENGTFDTTTNNSVTVNVSEGYAVPTVIRYVDYDYVSDMRYVLPYVPVGANVKYMLEIRASNNSFVCSSGIFEGPLPDLFYLASSVPVTIGAASGILYMVFEKTGSSYTYKAYLGYSDVTNDTNVGGILYSYEWKSYAEGGDIYNMTEEYLCEMVSDDVITIYIIHHPLPEDNT